MYHIIVLMFKFISPNGQETQYEERISDIKNNVSPIKEIISKKDFSSFSIVRDEQTISLQDVFQLQVNVKEVGTFHFIFNKEGFEKDEIINRIASLKEIEITDARTAKNKVTLLLDIVDRPCLLFMIYDGLDNSYIDKTYFTMFMNKDIQTFFIVKEQEAVEFYEVSVGEEEPQADAQKSKKSSSGKLNKAKIKQFFKLIADKKFHFLLILVSTVLFEVSIPLAIVNIYAFNAIYVFLFICSLIGIGMNGYSFCDLFKKTNPKSQLSIASYLTNVLGIGIGIGLFALFYHLSNVGEGVPSMGSMILIGLLVCLILCGAIIAVAYFIPKKNKQPKNSNNM